MLGAVGYSPVVSPHRIKQVCQPYQVVKVATEGVGYLLARSANEVWRRGKTVMIPLYFSLCYVFSFGCNTLILQRTSHRSVLCIALMSAHRHQPMHWHKGKCKKGICQVNTHVVSRKRHWLDTIYPKGLCSLLGHQKIVRGSCVPLRVSLSFVATKRRAFGVYFYQLFLYYTIIFCLSRLKTKI